MNGKRPAYPFALFDLLLAVEVESPSNPRIDYHTKRALYLNGGVPEYWVVNPTARSVSRWSRREDPGELLSERLSWHPEGMSRPLILDLPTFFAEAPGTP